MSDNRIKIVCDPELAKLSTMLIKSMKPEVKAIAEELSKAKWPDELVLRVKAA